MTLEPVGNSIYRVLTTPKPQPSAAMVASLALLDRARLIAVAYLGCGQISWTDTRVTERALCDTELQRLVAPLDEAGLLSVIRAFERVHGFMVADRMVRTAHRLAVQP